MPPPSDVFLESTFDTVFAALRRRWAVALACLLIVPAVAYALSAHEEKRYSASAALLFGNPNVPTAVLGLTTAQVSGSAVESTTDAQLVSLEIVQERTIAALARQLGPRYRRVSFSVSTGSQSDIATITATSTDSNMAAIAANTYAEQYIAIRKHAEQARLRSARQKVENQLNGLPSNLRSKTQGSTLQTAAQDLATLAALQTGGAELVQPASPPASANGSHKTRNVTLGALLGLVLAITAALVVDRMDRRIRNPREIQELFPWPALGAVPRSRHLRRRPYKRLLDGPSAEAMRTIRANLRYLGVNQGVSSVMVASVEQGDGASTLGYQLAVTCAALGTRVLYIEGDLRRPSSAERRGLSARSDLAQVLAGRALLQDAIAKVQIEDTDASEPKEAFTLDVLVAPTQAPTNPLELLESRRMLDILRQAKGSYALVIVNVTPPGAVTDAYPIALEVDGVIVVARMGHTTRLAAGQLRQRLESLGTRVLGVVFNCAAESELGIGFDPPTNRSSSDSRFQDSTLNQEAPLSHSRAFVSEQAAEFRGR